MKLIAYLSIFLMFLLVGISACDANERGQKAPDTKRMELDKLSQYSDQNYRVYTLEGCEYIVSGAGSHKWGSHKGNCKNHTIDSVKILKKEIQELNRYIKQLEDENQMMGSELGWREYNK